MPRLQAGAGGQYDSRAHSHPRAGAGATGGAAQRERDPARRRRHDPPRPRRGRGPDQRRDDLGGRGDRRRPRRRILLGSGRHDAAGPARAPRTRAGRVAGRATVHTEHAHRSHSSGPDRRGGSRGAGAPHRARDRAPSQSPRERRFGDRLHAAGAEAASRRGDDCAAPSPRRANRLHRRVTRRLVVDLASPRAAWRVQPSVVQAIRDALGEGWEVVEVHAPAASDGDGGSGTPEANAAARGAEIYLGYGVPAGVVQAARGTLKWAHSGTAGIGASLPHLRGAGVVLTNSAAVHADPIADWAIAALAYFARGLDRLREFQVAERWARVEFADLAILVREFGA